jgi:membrane protease YdiL (CAAX protease family)
MSDGEAQQQRAFSLGVVLLLAVVFLVADFIASVVYVSYRLHVYHESMDKLTTDPAILLSGEAIAYLFTFLTMFMLVKHGLPEPFWRGVQWMWPSRPAVVAGFLALGVPLALGITSLESILPMPSHAPFQKMFTGAAAAYGIGIFAVTVAPLMEELFFRGFMYPALRRYGTLIGVTGTSLAFALLHGAQYGWGWSVALMFAVGLVLTVARAWTGSVAPGFLIHVGYNLTLFFLLFLATDHFQHLERLTQ